MNNNFQPAVITSKAAKQDYIKIQNEHKNLLDGMAAHQQKVALYTQQKGAEMQAQNSMKAEIEKERIVADSQAKKDALNFQMKQSEIDVKRAALSMK